MARRTSLLVVAAALLLPAAAPAATWKVSRAPLAERPALALAGDRVAWLTPRRHDPGADLYVARAGRDPRRVQAFPAEDGGDVLELAASPSALAVLRLRERRLEVFAGPVGSRLSRIHRCTASASGAGVDAGDRVVAFSGCGGRVVVRDLDGTAPDVPLGVAADGAEIAGRHVAWIERGAGARPRVAVFDRERGGVSYSIPGEGVASLTLQDNGKLAFALERSDGLQVLGWATRRQPAVHGLDIANRFAYFPRLVGGRIAFGRAAVKATESDGREVGITDLWSGHVSVLSRHLSATTTVDFDGETIAYAERHGGDGARIRTRAAPPRFSPPR